LGEGERVRAERGERVREREIKNRWERGFKGKKKSIREKGERRREGEKGKSVKGRKGES